MRLEVGLLVEGLAAQLALVVLLRPPYFLWMDVPDVGPLGRLGHRLVVTVVAADVLDRRVSQLVLLQRCRLVKNLKWARYRVELQAYSKCFNNML